MWDRIVMTALAQAWPMGWSLGEILIAIIIAAACIAVVWIILRVMEISPPPWLIKILWIVVAAVVGILVIRFLLSL